MLVHRALIATGGLRLLRSSAPSRNLAVAPIISMTVKRSATVLAAGDEATTKAGRAAEGAESSAVEAKRQAKRPAKKAAEPAGPVFERSMRPPPLDSGIQQTKILSWNVAGLRALLKKSPSALRDLVDAEGADVLCLQEIKLQDEHCSTVLKDAGLGGWHLVWNCSRPPAKKGYSGTAIFSRQKPLSTSHGIGVNKHDSEGRVVTVEFPDFYVVNCYVPNSGEGLKRLEYRVNSWDKDFFDFIAGLKQRKDVVLTGDLNCAHHPIDIHNPKGNLRSAGFTQEERDSFTAQLDRVGLVDAFRRQYPDVVGYTYWGYRSNARANNKGWRLDYFLVNEGLLEDVHECYHMPELQGSDHCPLGLVLKRRAFGDA